MIKKYQYRPHKLSFFFAAVLWTAGCSQTSSSAGGSGSTASGGNYSITMPTGSNVMEVKIGGDCQAYLNEPCASVTICTPGTATCQTIGKLLVDTGSYGLRIFKSAMTVSLPAETDGSGKNYGTCVSYMDGSIQWGSVQTADITMGRLTASNVPIQVIDASFGGGPPNTCGSSSSVENDPNVVGFNGILGVGLFADDCGSACVNAATKYYYACTGSSCSETAIPAASQVTNPVAMLPTGYNNGVILEFPAIPTSGAGTATGAMILGIGTQTNNTLTGASFYSADSSGDVVTNFNGSTKSGFIDSGSSGLYFPGSTVIPVCTGNLSAFFCPSSLTSLSARIFDSSLNVHSTQGFYILNAGTIYAGSNFALSSLGGPYSSAFDWGLPFFYGRTIAFGINGKSSNLGVGPYFAF